MAPQNSLGPCRWPRFFASRSQRHRWFGLDGPSLLVLMMAATAAYDSIVDDEQAVGQQQCVAARTPSGLVCVGPEGRPASTHERRIFAMLGELYPLQVGDWFERACKERFFDSKLNLAGDDNDLPVFVVFRGAGNGPGFYLTWEEVAPCVVGYQGSLYQKCSGWVEAALRMVQAICIGGIVFQIPVTAQQPDDFPAWLSALHKSPLPHFHVDPAIFPSPLVSRDTASASMGQVLEVTQWVLFDLAKRLSKRTPPLQPLSPRPLRPPQAATIRSQQSHGWLHLRSPSPFPLASSLRSRQAPSLSAVGGAHPVPVPPSPSPAPTSRSRLPVDRTGFYVVFRGRVPWLYFTESMCSKMTDACVPVHSESYLTFSEALQAFREAARTGRLMVSQPVP
ncbi:hypothetical protein OH77DRAFT_1084050 [Trametes cingulata]|nr:hypothetical protein OH77DRAFT_1084050 [Trametes cingulata]